MSNFKFQHLKPEKITALDMIRVFEDQHRQVGVETMVAGGYALHLALGTEYTDIDYYIFHRAPRKIGETEAPKYFKKGGHVFLRESKDNYPSSKMTSYRCTELDVPLNFVYIDGLTPEEVLLSFDLSILRIASTGKSNFKDIDIKLDDFTTSIEQKVVRVERKYTALGRDRPDRIMKYKARLPDYEFVKPV